MTGIGSSASWDGRRYRPREKEQAIQMVGALREELCASQGLLMGVLSSRVVVKQPGYRVESVRVWVKQTDVVAGVAPGDDVPSAKDEAAHYLRRAEANQPVGVPEPLPNLGWTELSTWS